jgi:serine/threonine protein kinase
MSRLAEGKNIGEWTCLHPLGEGGNADVWAAEHQDGRRGAIKVVRDQRSDATHYRRFAREIETLRRLTPREGVIGILDEHLPEQPSKTDFAWLVMPVAEPLRGALEHSSVADVVAAFADIARTLADLHAVGLAHRDIKPANLYWHGGRASVGDFGLVELPDVESLHNGRVPGAFGFIPDEVLADPAGADGAAADVFSLAKTLWVILADQEFPPQGHIAADRGAATLSRRIVVGDIEALDRIIDRATAPEQVRLSMSELANELTAWSTTPSSRELPSDTAHALQLARRAMQETFTERDAELARAAAFDEAYELVRRRSDELFEVLQQLDPAAEVGAFANNFLHEYTEVAQYMGGPLVERHAHWGAVSRRDQTTSRPFSSSISGWA